LTTRARRKQKPNCGGCIKLKEKALLLLMDVKPTTRRGAVALLEYVAPMESMGEGREWDIEGTNRRLA
jgi:hypothetical protein